MWEAQTTVVAQPLPDRAVGPCTVLAGGCLGPEHGPGARTYIRRVSSSLTSVADRPPHSKHEDHTTLPRYVATKTGTELLLWQFFWFKILTVYSFHQEKIFGQNI